MILAEEDDEIAENEEAMYSTTALAEVDGYLNIIEKGKEMICTLQRRQVEVNRKLEQLRQPNPVSSPPPPPSAQQHSTAAKLPKLNLPTFSGDHLEWPKFWAIFKTNVHDRNLTGTEKFAYLSGQLTGNSVTCIAGLAVTDSNYDTAIKILRKRYERTPSQLVGTLYSQLKRLPKASSSVADMLQTYDACERIFRQLDDVGENVASNRSLVLDVLSKYPAEVVKDLMERKNVGPSSTLAELREALHSFIKQSEMLAEVMGDLDPFDTKCGKPKTSSGKPDSSSTVESRAPPAPKPTSAFAAASNSNNNRSIKQQTATAASNAAPNPNKPSNPCYFCAELHFNSRCQKFPTADVRIERLKALGRCKRCMSAGHIDDNCPATGSRLRCFFCKTTGHHASPLCPQEFATSTVASSNGNSTAAMASLSQSYTGQENSGDPTPDNVLLSSSQRAVLLTACVSAINTQTGNTINIRVLFDSGSHRTYITDATAAALGLKTLCNEPLNVAVFGTSRTLSLASRQVIFDIRQRDGCLKTINAHTTPVITDCPLMPTIIPPSDIAMMTAMKNSLADDLESGNGAIDVLIGSDYFWQFVAGATTTTPSGLYLIPSTVGTLIGGRCEDETETTMPRQHSSLLCITETFSRKSNHSGLVASTCHLPSPCPGPDIDEFWNLETIGITDDPRVSDDDEALRQFNDSVYLSEGRYQVKWPWKHNAAEALPTNFELAMGRFKSLVKRLRSSDAAVLKAYQSVIDDQLMKGVIEQVTDTMAAESIAKGHKIHHLPHHPVIKPTSTTTKVRIVYDASASLRKGSPSLNQCLYRGPVMLPDLCSILIRFRLHTMAIVSDIEKAFLQMSLQPSDRDVTRFIWFKDSTNLELVDNSVIYRFCRVPFGVISSPFLLAATICYHLKVIGGWVADRVREDAYVDNAITGVETMEAGKELYTSAKKIFAQAGMNLQEWCSNSEPIHHLPHHPVIKPTSTTTKVRIVYDASASLRKGSPSLNQCLYRGPVMLPDLCSILIRFRLHTMAIVSDIEKAFLQMSLQPSDRDVTRFIWFKDSTNLELVDNSVIYRFCRVPFGVISSPFLLAATICYHLKVIGGWVADRVREDAYVDNAITGVETMEAGKELYTSAKKIFAQAGMNLQEWCSNSEELMQFIPIHDRVKERDCKLLGLQWDSQADTLRIRCGSELCGTSKRHVLQSIASVYDPLGLFQPVLLPAKLFLQQLWADKIGWDDQLPEEKLQLWAEMKRSISALVEIQIPRCPCPLQSNSEVTIAAFCDASGTSYATAIFLRIRQDGQSHFQSNLVYAKSRLAPRQRGQTTVSLPRLELLGATIGARAAQFVRESLRLTTPVRVQLFTDSMCVLHWLKSPKPLSVFVENRVKQIQQLGNAEFLFVNTRDNPADLNTRGRTAQEIEASELWWKGPCWLATCQSNWPQQPDFTAVPSSDLSEDVAFEFRKTPPVFHTIVATELPGTAFLMGIDPTRYSSFRKLLRVTVWCLKFLKKRVCNVAHDAFDRTPQSIHDLFDNISQEAHISLREIDLAKTMWVRSVQQTVYHDVLAALLNNKRHTLVKQLGLWVDDAQLIRCGGRLQHADLSLEAINPILLPRKSHVTGLIVQDGHERLFHSGISHTLSQLRRMFWIPQGRAAVRRVLIRCKLCRKYKGTPFALPRMPPWPKERLARSSPFQFTGLDYLGPINVKVGSEVKKMWICLFTCLAVRAIHLEWISDCSAKEFLQCVIRFVSRRGTPSQIISDNAPQFRVTKTVFDRLWSGVLTDDTVRSYASENGIEWKFTTELAPWQGGFYERLVGIVKSALRSAVDRRLLIWEEFLTSCTEVEAVVNSRPITYVYGELQSGLALRPIDFITDLHVGMPATDGRVALRDLGDAGKNLVRLWKHKEKRLNLVWELWYSEYLLSLRERHQSTHKGTRGELNSSPKVGEVVLVKDTDQPRGSWKLATVETIVPSKDNLIRAAEVKLGNGSIIRRAVNFLYPLEIDSANETNIVEVNRDSDVEEEFEGFTEDEVEATAERVKLMQAARNNINDNLTTVAFTILF